MATELLTAAMPGMMEHAYNPSMWEAKVGGYKELEDSQENIAGLCLKEN